MGPPSDISITTSSRSPRSPSSQRHTSFSTATTTSFCAPSSLPSPDRSFDRAHPLAAAHRPPPHVRPHHAPANLRVDDDPVSPFTPPAYSGYHIAMDPDLKKTPSPSPSPSHPGLFPPPHRMEFQSYGAHVENQHEYEREERLGDLSLQRHDTLPSMTTTDDGTAHSTWSSPLARLTQLTTVFSRSTSRAGSMMEEKEKRGHGWENTNAILSNPLFGRPRRQVYREARGWARQVGLTDYDDLIGRGALLAQDPLGFEDMDELRELEREALRNEQTHPWKQTKDLWFLIIACSLGAAVQGMDESVIAGAQVFFAHQFNLPTTSIEDPTATAKQLDQNAWLLGAINAAPYICCGLISCWLNDPLNNWFGRRGTIFFCALLSFASCIWQGCSNTWQMLFVSRLLLGLGIGPKSASTPVWSAECAPARIRGGLVMMWQMWTAFGIMLGYTADLCLYRVKSGNVEGLNWRLMLGSAGLPAFALMFIVFFAPESPRWLMSRQRYREAFESMRRLRLTDIQAARDFYYAKSLLTVENDIALKHNRFIELFVVKRNLRAVIASCTLMIMQQFCGVNVLVYYCTTTFLNAGFSQIQALASAWAFGFTNWIFALPAVAAIDRYGRRTLLLLCFIPMAACMLLTGFAFLIPDMKGRAAGVTTGALAFTMFYSVSEGPVPFTYAAECFPLYVRGLGMGLATAVDWTFNSMVSLTFPSMSRGLSPQGAFSAYALFNLVGWWLILLFVPETKQLTLEELDQVFSVPTRKHAAYQMRQVPYFFRRYFLRQHPRKEELYEFEGNQANLFANYVEDFRWSAVVHQRKTYHDQPEG